MFLQVSDPLKHLLQIFSFLYSPSQASMLLQFKKLPAAKPQQQGDCTLLYTCCNLTHCNPFVLQTNLLNFLIFSAHGEYLHVVISFQLIFSNLIMQPYSLQDKNYEGIKCSCCPMCYWNFNVKKNLVSPIISKMKLLEYRTNFQKQFQQ